MVVGAIAGVVLTLFVGEGVKGATRWIHIGGFKIQPSEFLKPSLVMLTAWLFSVKEPEIFRRNFLVSLGIMAVIAVLLLLQPNFGMLMILGGVWIAQVWLAGYPFIWLAGAGMMVIVGAYFGLSHVRSRIDRFLDPASGDAYQVEQGLEALTSGGFIGRGPGEGIVKHSLPDAHTDFIFAVIGEEFGLIACCLLLVLYGAFLYRSFALLLEHEDRFTLLAGTGLIVLFGAQVLLNAGVVLHLLPTTGVTMPFISYGGSSTFAMAIMVGLILALTRKGDRYANPRNARD
jgi:cell division protein FtsW